MITKRKQGFTLIEILIVIAIIAILASVVLIGLGPTQQAGRDARRISDMQQVRNGIALYYSRCGFYPGGANCGARSGTPTWTTMSTALTGSSIVQIMPADPGANAYSYGSLASSSFTIMAVLESNNPVLKTSITGSSDGLNCDVATFQYCIGI